MKRRQQTIILCITLVLVLVCMGFCVGFYLGSHVGKCKAILERHWREFEQSTDKVALGATASNPSLVYGQSIREIWKDPETKYIKLYFKCDPRVCRGDSDGYARKDENGKWYYKIP